MKRTSVEGSNKVLSAVGLGCSRVGSFSNPLSGSEVRRLLAAAFDSGVSVFDTADVYGQGDSERELGRFLSGHRRDAAFVVTKGGKLFSTKMRLMRPFKPLLKPLLSRGGRSAVTARRTDEISSDFSPSQIVRAVEGSLRRLRADTLDGFLLHSPPASVVAGASIWEAIVRLKQAGKITTFGVSCDTKEVLAQSLKVPGLSLLELPYDVLSVMDADVAGEIARRKILVLAREVIRFQPNIAPETAIANAASMPMVSTVIVGTSKIQNLRTAVAATSP